MWRKILIKKKVSAEVEDSLKVDCGKRVFFFFFKKSKIFFGQVDQSLVIIFFS